VTSHSTLSVPKKEPTSLGLDLQFCKTLTDRNAIPWVCIRHSSSKEMQFTLHDRCCSYRLLHPRRKIIAEIYLERERIKMSISKSNAWTGCEDKENAHSHIQLLFKNRELKKTRRRHCWNMFGGRRRDRGEKGGGKETKTISDIPRTSTWTLELSLSLSLSVALKIFYLERMCIRKERASPMVDISKRYWKRDTQILHNVHLWKIISGHINKEVLLSSSFFMFLHVSSAFPIFMFAGINARRWATSLDYQNLLKKYALPNTLSLTLSKKVSPSFQGRKNSFIRKCKLKRMAVLTDVAWPQ